MTQTFMAVTTKQNDDGPNLSYFENVELYFRNAILIKQCTNFKTKLKGMASNSLRYEISLKLRKKFFCQFW